MFAELKFEFVQTGTENSSFSTDADGARARRVHRAAAPARAACATGGRFVVDGSFDFTVRKHALRTGLLFEAGQWDSTQQTNANGTYTFSSLDEFEAGLAPAVQPTASAIRWSATRSTRSAGTSQDDFRLSKNLQVSLGLRQEVQTHVDDSWNLAPRAAFTWTVAKTNIRGGWGVFYDWFDSGTYEQTLRLDGTHQIDEFILNPTYPALVGRVRHSAAAEHHPAGR